MKLEAVDKGDPFVIGVASVVEVDADRIRIQFDGFKGSGYWTTYLDRDLFNAGWCLANGYPLRPPGINDIQRVVIDINCILIVRGTMRCHIGYCCWMLHSCC